MFTSENDRLEKINNAHLALIGYMGRTVKDLEAEIAALKDRLRAKPVHGQELEAERDAKPVIPQRLIDENIALRGECVQHMVELQRLENEARDLRAEIGRLRNHEPTFVGTDDLRCGSGAATDDTSNLRELDKSAEIAKNEQANRVLNKAAVRKVLEEGRRISKGVKYDRCVENQRVKSEEGKGLRPSVSVEFKPVKIVSPVRSAARRAMAQQMKREEGRV